MVIQYNTRKKRDKQEVLYLLSDYLSIMDTTILTISISSLALIVSAINSYHQHFKKRSKLNVRLIDVDITDEAHIKLEYLFGNTGTVLHHLNKIFVVSGQNLKNLDTSIESLNPDLPLIIDSNKVHRGRVTFPASTYSRQIASGNAMYVRFDILSPSGKVINYFHDIQGLMEEHKNRIHLYKTSFMHKPKDNPSGAWITYK